MEVFFYEFLNFFPQEDQPLCRQEEEPEQQGRPIGCQAQKKEHRRTQEQKIEHGPQHEGRPHIDTHNAPAYGDGIGKEPHSSQAPERQVQQPSHQREPEPPAENPQNIIRQAQAAPQSRRPQKGPDLLGQVDAHGPIGTAGPGSLPAPRRRPRR